MRSLAPAYVPYRRPSPGLAGHAAALQLQSQIATTRLTIAPTAPFGGASALHSHSSNSDEVSCCPADTSNIPLLDGPASASSDGSRRMHRGVRPGQNSERAGTERIPGHPAKAKPKARSAASALVSLLCAVTVVLGTPTFEGGFISGDVAMNCNALALESASNNDQAAPTWASQSLSDKLLKSMSDREVTRSPPTQQKSRRYWDVQTSGSAAEITSTNEKLVDHAVATISTMYYDSSGGFNFNAQDFYAQWKRFRNTALRPHEGTGKEKKDAGEFNLLAESGFATREDTVKTLKSIVSALNDPYSKYLTRDELRKELEGGDDGFLGLGALVDVSPPLTSSLNLALEEKTSLRFASPKKDFSRVSNRPWYGGQGGVSLESISPTQQFAVPMSKTTIGKADAKNGFLSVSQAQNLPVITAVIPDSPAERAGLVVGDRLAAVGDHHFTGMSRSQVEKELKLKFHADNYFGRADLTVAKPVSSPLIVDSGAKYDTEGNIVEEKYVFDDDGWYRPRSVRRETSDDTANEQLLGFKLSHVKSIPTTLTAKLDSSTKPQGNPAVFGGDNVVHFELLTPDDSIFQHLTPSEPVGYIRLTRFSKSSTAGYINAINSLEEAGAQSYIIDLRNNYGGVIQEAMVTASTLLRDPHSVLCYTLNSRGGFKPQENMEYVVDKSYPGYLLSSEPRTVSRDQVRREHPEYLEDGGWSAPTSYASLKELRMTRGIKPAHAASSSGGIERPTAYSERKDFDLERLADVVTRSSQKKLVILINEGTASAAEVFASALHDNGRTTALVGTKTFGKGLIQHTFPMPDGGGLRLTVAEYLTPSLQHVTKVGGAKYDSGVKPDIRCESKQGIPQNVGADLCVGVALDVLDSGGG